jgi:hypothetical protein
MKMHLSAIKKTLINVLTVVVTAGPWILKSVDLLPGTPAQQTTLATAVSSVLGLAAVLLHYLVPNTTTDPTVAATQSVRLVGPSAAPKAA